MTGSVAGFRRHDEACPSLFNHLSVASDGRARKQGLDPFPDDRAVEYDDAPDGRVDLIAGLGGELEAPQHEVFVVQPALSEEPTPYLSASSLLSPAAAYSTGLSVRVH